ncbi:MAG: hypothetical protein ABSC55_28920 [Syntrophorhabdales bacterium]|jgi:hypothetical protein
MNQGKISVRNFLLDDQDRIYRLPLSKSVAMMRDPEANPCPQFAGKRVRGTETFVELSGGYPVRITRMIYYVLTFDEHGVLNKELHMRQEMAKYNLYLNEPSPAEDASVLDAKDRFLTSGGQWRPTPALEERLRDAALGRLKSHRV